MAEPAPSPSVAYAGLTDASNSSASNRVRFFSSADHASNAVCTSRYTWWNFLPLFLFESFSKTANIYFLLVGTFQAIPSISPTGGIPTHLFPLAAVVLIDAVFAALEDYRRHRDDATANATITRVYRPASNSFGDTAWSDVRVGDVLRVANHETIAADAVLLSTQSDVSGVCYVETKSLDGESNLKRRHASKPTRRVFVTDDDHVSITDRAYIELEAPNADVHAFTGTLVLPDVSSVPLSIENVLLRGAKLRNADAAYALVVRVGVDCKVLRGSLDAAPAKVSSLDALVNRQVRIVVVFLVAACLVGAVTDVSSLADLTFVSASADKTLFESLAYYLTILCDLVPITLYVTITVVRAFQSYFMGLDLAMYDASSDTPLTVRSMQLNEQLGQITHVLTDKTGTLTCNDMVWRKCSVHGTNYESIERLTQDEALRLQAFFTHVALCHSVLLEHGSTTEYSAASPDEQTLVIGARDYGDVAFVGRGHETITLEECTTGEHRVYHVLEVLAFTSARKRMTVVVQAEDDKDHVLVLTKGSDSVVFPRLAANAFKDATQSHLMAFAHDGLRTLVFAQKTMTLDAWQSFHTRYSHARLTSAIDTLQDELESDLDLVGATAIEDRLQDGVPETIAKLRAAGIAVWMLTGDMLETAVNVARACHLVDDHVQCHVIRASSDTDRESLLQHLEDIYRAMTSPPLHGLTDVQHAVVLDGATLVYLLDHDESASCLARVALQCHAVIACRVSPLQKAQLVTLVKQHVPTAHTLAIGDGANDVPMLRTAHVGVGIAGQEGRQAVNASDYAIAQFRFLQSLLLVHGRWNYERIATLVGYTFYKNIVYSLSLLWFSLAPSSFSGAMLYSPMIQNFYNLVFTVLPIALLAIQDRDLPSRDVALSYPVLYRHSMRLKRANFTQWTFWTWVASAVVDSVALLLVILAASFGVMPHGEAAPLTVVWSLGWTVLVTFVTARFCLLVHSWTIIEIAGVVASLGAMVGVQVLFDAVTWGGEDFNTYAFPWLLARPQLWLGVALAVVGILVKDVAFGAYARCFEPQAIDLVHEQLQNERKARRNDKFDVRDDVEVGVDDRISLMRPSLQ